MDAPELAAQACRKIGLPSDTSYMTLTSVNGYKARLQKAKGMTLVLTESGNVRDKLIADGWSHRGFSGGDVLYKVV
tara:strand:- start:592 stop:819 length:228 start_codon:yes stop_codon:yes gene_type:complete